MSVLVINSGSSSLKFKLFELDSEAVIFQGEFQNYQHRCNISYRYNNSEVPISESYPITELEYDNRVNYLLNLLSKFSLTDAVTHIAHRIVHGGQKFKQATYLSDGDLVDLEELSNLAPLHNPPALLIIHQLKKLWPLKPQLAAFDTAFHSTIPISASIYAIPYNLTQKYNIKRYGFHGLSHKYVVNQLCNIWKINDDKLSATNSKIINCHLGSGASVCAVLNGQSVETSMGFGPDEGLVMATRAGDIGASVIHFLQKKLKISSEEVLNMLNRESGLIGVSELSNNMRELLHDYGGESQAELAVDLYIHRLIKYIGAYTAVMGGLDALVFTGGVGQGSDIIREKIAQKLLYLGLKIDSSLNVGKENVQNILRLDSIQSKVQVWVIPTNEDIQILQEVRPLILEKLDH